MGLVHAAAIRTHPQINLAAMCDTSKFMVQALGKFLDGVTLYTDYEKMLPEVDVVFVATPSGSHADIAEACARAGKAVFVEKPLGTSLAEAERAAQAVGEAKVASQVGYVCRYAPTFEKAKAVLDSGALGPIKGFGSVKYSSDVLKKPEKSWRFMRRSRGSGGGALNEFTCHGVDLLVWMFGQPRDVTARLESWYSEEVEDHVHAVMEYGTFSGWLDSGWSMQDYRKPYNKIEVTGDNGRLVVTDSEIRWLLNAGHAGMDAGWHSATAPELYEPVRMFVGDIMFTRQADDFIAYAAGGAPSKSPAAEALTTQRVLEAIHQGNKR